MQGGGRGYKDCKTFLYLYLLQPSRCLQCLQSHTLSDHSYSLATPHVGVSQEHPQTHTLATPPCASLP